MTVAADDIDTAAWLETVSRLVDLPVPEAYRDGVVLNLRVIAIHMDRLNGYTPDDHTEPAPVYRP